MSQTRLSRILFLARLVLHCILPYDSSHTKNLTLHAVETWFGDVVLILKIVLLQLQNCHCGLGPIMLQIQFWIRYIEESLNMCQKWPKPTWRKRRGDFRRRKEKSGAKLVSCRVTLPVCMPICHVIFRVSGLFRVPGLFGVYDWGACFPPHLFFFLFQRDESYPAQHRKVQGVPSGSNTASAYPWTAGPTGPPSFRYRYDVGPPSCLLFYLLSCVYNWRWKDQDAQEGVWIGLI